MHANMYLSGRQDAYLPAARNSEPADSEDFLQKSLHPIQSSKEPLAPILPCPVVDWIWSARKMQQISHESWMHSTFHD